MFDVIVTWILAHARSERGQDLIEYALLGGLIAAAILAAATLVALTTGIGNCIDFAPSPCG